MPICCESVSRQAPCYEHAAHFYTDSESLLKRLVPYVQTAIDQGYAVIIIAMPGHGDALTARLRDDGAIVQDLVDRQQLMFVDATHLREQIMRDGQPNRRLFDLTVEQLIRNAIRRFKGLAVYGELVNQLWQQENYRAAMTLEHWWNDVIERHGFSLLCGYRANILSYQEFTVDRLDEVCQTHTHVATSEDGERLEAAVDSALRQVLPDSDVTALRQALTNRTRPGLHVSPAQAVLLGLHELLPSLAHDVRMIARDHYR